MASLDTRRPAAQEQLRQLGEQVGVATLPIIAGQTPVEIARRAVQAAKLGGHDVVILDTAGRTHIDEPLMVEMAEIKKASQPARDPAGRRFADRPGRRQPRQELRRARRHHRPRADPHGRRRPRRRRAFHARRHRQADQADRHRRKDGRAGGVPPQAHRRPHPRHGRHRLARREGRRKHRRREGGGDGQEDAVGQVRPERPRRPAAADVRRWAAWAASWA